MFAFCSKLESLMMTRSIN